MNDITEYKSFDAGTVELDGSNLIEASAGTGKTYSIAILVLRLLLEKNIAVKEILMVTFTKAAVAELEERVRYFVRSAYKVSQDKTINDVNITGLVHKAIESSGREKVHQILKDAVLFLDETSVMTIHSFCKQTLNEFAFETDQLFGTEMIPEISDIIEEELNKSWRKHITTLPVALLRNLWNSDMKNGLKNAIKEHLGGKKYFGYDASTTYKIDKTLLTEWSETIEQQLNKEPEMRLALLKYVEDNRDDIITNTINATAKKNVIPLIDTPQEFLDSIWEKKKSQYIATTFPYIFEKLKECDDCPDEYDRAVQAIVSRINFIIIHEVSQGVENHKLRNNLLGYDDMIQNLHRALVKRDNPVLVSGLREKFKAVFIDEFQDTDRQQFEIFDKAFGSDTTLFYIGDPKQSIYAWRKADIFTYFKARHAVQHVYGMNHNYRSSASLIDAMNEFFLPSPGFDTFSFKDDADAIRYHPVESPAENTKGFLVKNGVEDIPISIFHGSKREMNVEILKNQVSELLYTDHYSIFKNDQHRNIIPSDIGILVRSGHDGRSVKAALARAGIPAVTIDDAKVLQSNESIYLQYLLEAMASPDRSAINRALLSPFTGLSTQDILLLDDEVVLGLFNNYKIQWEKDGVYTAIMQFISDFAVRNVLINKPDESGERTVTNLFQVIELLHQIQSRKNFSMPELISWLKRGISGMATEGDEYSQRVESDEDAVKIVTIHKSKGLEYNIVLAPFLDLEIRNDEFISFRSPDSGEYFAMERLRATAEQVRLYEEQAEQENRRLVYVALTRAVYKCFIFRNNAGKFKNSTLSVFLGAMVNPTPKLIRIEEQLPESFRNNVRNLSKENEDISTSPVSFNLLEPNWRKMSYTMLAAKGELQLRAGPQKNNDPYENFIFYTLRRGAKTGNLLHYIFENVNFSDEAYWEKLLQEAIRRFLPGQEELFLPMLRLMLQHVFNTRINSGDTTFSLSNVDYYKRIPEFEFDFPVMEFNPDVLNELSDELSTINVKGFHELNTRQLEGIMNGKMDLFFEYSGRYYILDWKSNYLGPVAEDYSSSALAAAMNENNYHLQYLIYTVAAKKYLESRLPSFDYETQFGGVIYLFVRGMRQGSTSGIFTARPSLERINKLGGTLTQLSSST